VHPHADFGNMHCMNADLSDLLRLLQNLIRLGTIAEINGAKARVRLGPTLTTEWLNWATRRAGSTRTWSAPTVGEQVIVFSSGGDLTRSIILPALYSQAFDAPESSPTIHTTHYPDGAVVQYDHAVHALTALLPGGTATITADKVTSNTPSTICTGDLTVMQNLILMQAATINGATGGATMTVQGTIKASKDVLVGAISLLKHPHGNVKAGDDQPGWAATMMGMHATTCASSALPQLSARSLPAFGNACPAGVFTTTPIAPPPLPHLRTDIILTIK
jgi:phage baseplate assembly protein V